MSSVGRAVRATLGVLVLAPLWFGLGLLSPLTPSEGAPSLVALLAFWVAPMISLASVWAWDKSVVGRLGATAVFLLILVPYLVLIWPLFGSA